MGRKNKATVIEFKKRALIFSARDAEKKNYYNLGNCAI